MYRDKPKTIAKFPTQRRHCTDFLFALIFIVFLVAVLLQSAYGFYKGDISRIMVPYDVDGNACGKSGLEKYPYLFWNDYKQASLTDNTVCVDACPGDDKT